MTGHYDRTIATPDRPGAQPQPAPARRSRAATVARVGAVVVLVGALVAGLAAAAGWLDSSPDGHGPDLVIAAPAARGTFLPGGADTVVWSADGTTLYASGASGVQVIGGSPLARVAVFAEGAAHAAWSPDRARVAVPSDQSVAIWDVATRAQLASIPTPAGRAAPAWSPDGSQLAVQLGAATISLRDGHDGHELRAWQLTDDTGRLRGAATEMQWVTSDRIVATNLEYVMLVDPTAGRIVSISNRISSVALAAVSSDGSRAFVAGGAESMVLDTRDGRAVDVPLGGMPRGLRAASWSPNGTWLFASPDSDKPLMWKVGQPLTTARVVAGWSPYDVGGVWSPDSTRVAVADTYEWRVDIVDPTGTAKDVVLTAPNPSPPRSPVTITEVAWAPQGDRLAVVGSDGSIVVWKVPSG